MSAFMRAEEIRYEEFEWGSIGWRCTPATVGAKQLVVMDVEILPGGAHNFHRHPGQEEVIIVSAGEIEQWVGEDKKILGPGGSAYIAAGQVHASFTLSSEPARLQVVIGPALATGTGYDLEDVSGQEPWASLRPGGLAV
jgi:quercetin dioxygenase-like cupin family protein